MIERAKRRGEVAADIDPEIIADLLSSFAWIHLLTSRLEAGEEELTSVVRAIMHGIKKGYA